MNKILMRTLESSKARTQEWFSSYKGPIDFEIRDLEVTAGEDVAFYDDLSYVAGTLKNGDEVDIWVRAPICFQRIDSTWRVTHEHNPAPSTRRAGGYRSIWRPHF